MCDAGGEADEYPSYMVIYEALHDICKEQRSIIDKGVDLAVLCSTFGALPRLTEVRGDRRRLVAVTLHRRHGYSRRLLSIPFASRI